jgi:hypothetical protein
VKRRRQQTGYVFQARGHWYVRFFEDRMLDGKLQHVRVAKQIAEMTTRGKRPPREIQNAAKEIVAAASALPHRMR